MRSYRVFEEHTLAALVRDNLADHDLALVPDEAIAALADVVVYRQVATVDAHDAETAVTAAADELYDDPASAPEELYPAAASMFRARPLDGGLKWKSGRGKAA